MLITLRRSRRLVELVWVLAGVAPVDYLRRVALFPMAGRARRRAEWVQRISQRLARVFELRIVVAGRRESTPMLVANHLGYLDILVLGAVTPLAFVAKAEVRHWPLLGWLTHIAGTIFLQRDRPRDTVQARQQIEECARQAIPVVVFPEGTSSDGTTILPFRSALLEPAAQMGWPVQAAHLVYAVPGDAAGSTVCWWGRMTLAPHLWRLLGQPVIYATVRFGPCASAMDRKELAACLHTTVTSLACAKISATVTDSPLECVTPSASCVPC